MKLSIDFDYIIKRIIVVVLAFVIISQLKSCDVQAATYNISPTSCAYNTGTSSTFNNGSVSGNSNSVNLSSPFYYCTGSTGNNIAFRYNITTPSNVSSSTGVLSFNIYGASISNVILRTGGYDYSCILNTGVEIDNTNNKVYSVTCSNIPMSSSRTWSIYTYKSLSGSTNVFISSNFVYIPNENIGSIISNQSTQQHEDAEQAHQDSQNINNSLNDSSISTDTNSNASDIFDIDIDTGHGLTAIITAPLSFLSHTQDTCTSKSFSLFGKSITLPCGTSLFWARDFSSYNSIFNSGLTGSGLNTARDNFRLFWNILFGGAIVFHLLIKLWEQINLALDPMSDSFQTLSSAIDTGRPVRDEDELAPRPVVKLHGLQAKNVDSFVASKEV